MTEFRKAVIAGAILGASLGLIANYAHASVAKGEAGHHGAAGLGSTASAQAQGQAANAAAAAAGDNGAQGGQGGSYFSPDLRGSMVDGYQPWPQAEMKQFEKN